MLFTINDLGFSIAGLLLEGWLAFAARRWKSRDR